MDGGTPHPALAADDQAAILGSRRRRGVDGVFFIIPMVAIALVVCALVAPDLLRRIARFLDTLATAA